MAKIKLKLDGVPGKATFNVPEGMDPKQYALQVVEKHNATMAETREMSDPTSDSDWEHFRAGIGRGMSNVARNVANIAGVEGYDDETLRQKNELDQALLDTKAGMAGNIAGEIAITAPVTGGLMAGGKVIQGADKLRKGNLFRKTIGSSPAVLGADAALTMGVAGGPDDRLKNAALGGTIGLATGGLIKGGASLVNKPWIRKSKEALALEARTGKNIPLSQSGTGPGKLFYESIVANFPGSAKAIRGQYDDALDDFRKFVSEEAMPPGGLQELPANWATMSAQNMIKTLREGWEGYVSSDGKRVLGAYERLDLLNTLPMRLNLGKGGTKTLVVPEWWNKYAKEIGAPKIGKDITELTGKQLFNLKNDASNLLGKLDYADKYKRAQLIQLTNSIDDTIAKNVGKGKGKIAEQYKQYQDLSPYYKKYQDIQNAASKALGEGSEFTPKQLLRSTNERIGRKGTEGSGALNLEASLGSKALGGFPSNPGIYQLLAAAQIAGGLFNPALLAFMPAMRGMASPWTQRLLAGQNPTMRSLAKKLRRGKEGIKFGGAQATKGGILYGNEE